MNPQTTQPNWDKVLADIGSASSGPFFFPKTPKTKIRLICQDPDPTKFFVFVQTEYKGKPKQKVIVLGKVISTDGKELSSQWTNKVVPIIIAKTALKGIIAQLAEGYDLFDPEKGYGLSIIKTGKGTETDYNVIVSPQPVPLGDAEMPHESLEEFAAMFAARSSNSKEEGDW